VIVAEYLEIFAEVLKMKEEIVEEWRQRMTDDRRVTTVDPVRHESASRDPDDNAFLSAAIAGKSRYLITNDRDLTAGTLIALLGGKAGSPV
jgi:putative PIN family toxin of toxin-antitoxin system